MAEKIFVKPGDGARVRLEDGSGYVPAEGALVERTRFVSRRLADGDLIETKPAATPASAPAPVEADEPNAAAEDKPAGRTRRS